MSGKKRKGLSLDDKRKAILGIYHEKLEPLNLKEIESLGSKVGVVQQSIKEINQSLVDDSLVCAEKIGAANFYWSFPSKGYQDQINIKHTWNSTLHSLDINIGDLEIQLKDAESKRCGTNRETTLKRLYDCLEVERQLDSTLDSLKFNDPEEIRRIDTQSKLTQDGANRWTDNMWVLKGFLTRKKGMNSKEVDKILKIDGDFDYPSFG